MVAFPEFLKRHAEPAMTVASIDALHRVQRRSVMMALEPMICTRPPDDSDLRHHLSWVSHLEQTASLRARFYSLRQKQTSDRQVLIDDICQKRSRV